MPRKAPDGKGVIEHRLTLGDFERKLIKKQLDEDDLINKAKAGAEIGKTIAITGAVVGGTIAAATVGGLAVSAYREANQLVEGAQDLGAGAWSTFKWRVGLTSFDDYLAEIGNISTETEEERAEKERRKNMGILEWGLDRVLVFLLGQDKKWTSTTLVREEDIQEEENLTSQEQEQNRFQRIYELFGSEEAHIRWLSTKLEWDRAVDQFCNINSEDYDIEVCREVTQDRSNWIHNSAWPTYPNLP